MSKNLFQRNGIWWIRAERNRSRMRVSTHSRDLAVACVVRDAFLAGLDQKQTVNEWACYSPATHQELLTWMTKARDRAIRRDRKRGRVAMLSAEDGTRIVERSGGRCELTGIAFSLERAPGTFRRPLAPSLDRIDNARPYSADNCRLICLCVNVAINEWGIALFRRVAQAYFVRENVAALGTPTATVVPRETVSS